MNDRFVPSIHALDVMEEREILGQWLQLTLHEPDSVEADEEGNIHYFRAIPEFEGRVLHVVVNPDTNPQKIVTLFFDRRRRRRQ